MITSAICTSFKLECLGGEHEAGDTYKLALYTSSATLDDTTIVYTTTGEVAGMGYTVGGATLAGFTRGSSGTTAWITWANTSFAASALVARGLMIYNSTNGNKAVCVVDFGADKTSVNGAFNIDFPTADASNAIVRFGGPC